MVYFNDQRLTPELANILFKFRTNITGLTVKNNFRNNYINTELDTYTNTKVSPSKKNAILIVNDDIFIKRHKCTKTLIKTHL